MRKLLSLFMLCGAVASAQDTAPVTPQQFVKSEQAGQAYSLVNNELQPADALNLMLQCSPPISTAYDSNGDGQNDTLRVYGFSLVAAQIYQARGVTSLAPAIQKAQLRANGAAAEFFGGLRTTVQRGMESRNMQASSVVEDKLRLSDLAVETLTESVSTSSQAVLRQGRVTGHRIVSLGNQGLCVVARYELPLDQRSGPSEAPPSTRPPAPGSTAPTTPGFTVPPPGKVGDF